MAGMGGNAFGIGGSLMNDFINIGDAGISLAGNANDMRDLNYARYNFDLTKISPDDIQIAAEQMGIPPEVLASRIRGDQLNALRQLQNIGAQGGMDDAAIAANRQAQMETAQQRRGDEQAIQSSLQRRGISAGSGAELGMRQNVAQESANRLSQEGLQNAANAQMRALQAINSAGRLAGDIASSDEARMMANRQAAMERDRYNTGIRNAVNQYNAEAVLGAKDSNNRSAQAFGGYELGRTGRNQDIRRSNREQTERMGERVQNATSTMGSMFGGFGG